MRVFLTGATGLIGSHLAALLRAKNHEVVALVRPRSNRGFLSGLGCRLVDGDVRDDPDRLAAAIEGCGHVCHSAALVYDGGEWPKVRAVNVDGTRNVLRAAALAGVEHAVHVSSVAVYGPAAGVVDESTPTDTPLPPADLYARSKREAEDVARGIEAARNLSITIVRPSAVYGERDRLMTPAVAKLVRLPVVPLFGTGENTLPVVYAGNVASAIERCLAAGRGHAVFDVGRDVPLTQRRLFELLAAGLGRRPRFARLSGSLVRAVAGTLDGLGVGTPGARHLSLERVARIALGENPYPSRRIRRELGWTPEHDHAQSLPRTGAWLLAQR
ncbi:MAG: NAD-dependent epimerase/dehydratase family protein [Gemmatimonadota bacterium]|nr:NAD-dependent epimerase/dehydratase family protein [Gemmatimonadota bacterium]MDH3422520.1 NAD-dependent epimerase/dehydratase family protein [Gemmatimonadota bacterium]